MSLTSALIIAESYQTALIAIVSGKVSSYTIGDTTFNRHSIADLEKAYQYWRHQAQIEANGGSNIYHAEIKNLDIDPGDIIETMGDE